MKKLNEPLVSIICPTFNHEKFIKQTLDSFVAQVTNFSFEIIVHDDASTDGTGKIVKEYELKHPDLFRNIYQSDNQFSKDASIVTRIMYEKARGKYFALCEGDDFWTDPNKLQKQVDFLEQNLNYSICFTNLNFLINNNLENSDINQLINSKKNHSASLENFLSPYVWYTPTCVFRNVVNFNKIKALLYDTSIFSILLKYGNAYLINEVTSVYRIHNQGSWSMKSKLYKLKLNTKIFKSMAYFHNGKVKLINESFLWGVIDIIRNQESNFQDKFIYMVQFLFFCFYKPKYFPLFWKELIKVKLTKIMK